eukprot:CAMPEP_0183593110 /NCGR_PEP_ID=MMETSP0371-20130417/169204_1 /TAXON_ID=268820 /ORGANISM="Peridinium aciculiferum, Strain PAER-2" /LENGTH=37 /DNA_ID= /DNA_START= /DNA_END= /DNA_ORIENTATION=
MANACWERGAMHAPKDPAQTAPTKRAAGMSTEAPEAS